MVVWTHPSNVRMKTVGWASMSLIYALVSHNLIVASFTTTARHVRCLMCASVRSTVGTSTLLEEWEVPVTTARAKDLQRRREKEGGKGKHGVRCTLLFCEGILKAC